MNTSSLEMRQTTVFFLITFYSLGAAFLSTTGIHSRCVLGRVFRLVNMGFVIQTAVSSTAAVTPAIIASSTVKLPTSTSDMGTYPQLTSYKTFLASARCQARCNANFGMKNLGTPQEFAELYRPFVCGQDHSTCQQTTDICRDSCNFLNTAVRQEADESSLVLAPTSVLPARAKRISLTTPLPACLYTPAPHELDSDSGGSTIVLKWNVLGSNGQTTSYPLSFVVELKEQKENGRTMEWKVLGYTNFTVIPIVNLDSSSEFLFRVSAVSEEGLVTLPVSSEWIRLPSALNPQPPQNVSVAKQYVRGYTLRAEVEWTMPSNVGCYFKLYWMTPKKGSFYSRELKEWIGFRYELNNLDFDSDYILEIQTYDRFFQIPSEKVTIEFSTPSCLQSTNYNYYSCAPDSPVDLSFNISKPFEVNKLVYTNVTMTWKPPKHISWHNIIDRYVISWRKTPDIRFTQLITPDRRAIYLNGNTTEWTATFVHWDSEYIAKIAAESTGGLGDQAGIRIVTGKGYSQLVSQENYVPVTVSAESSNKVYYITIIPTITGAVITIFCALFYFRLRKNTPHLEREVPARKEERNPLYEMTAITNTEEGESLIPNDKYEIDYCCLKFTDLLGEGAFGKVLKAVFTPSNPRTSQGTTERIVAVKMLKEHATPEERRFLLLEIAAMKSLGYHPHLVSIIACVTDIDRPCLIMEFCQLGDLRNYLRQHRNQVIYMPRLSVSNNSSSCTNSTNAVGTTSSYNDMNPIIRHSSKNTDLLSSDASETLSQTSLLSYARQIAVGMEYLNQHRFIHRDLASRNILMSSHKVVKISDFGLARDVYETNVYQPTSGRCLPFKWMPIESIFDQTFTIKSDVWSYGILLWEIVTLGGCPYPGIPNKDLFRLLKEGYRLGRPSNCSSDIYSIMLSCWHPRPEDRPSFTQLRKKMENLLEATCSYIDLSTEISWDSHTNNSSGHESVDAECQKDDSHCSSEQARTVELPVSGTSDVHTTCRDSADNTFMCQRYFRFDISAFPSSRMMSKNCVRYPPSSDPYSFDSNGPVPGLSEELLQKAHSSAEQENRILTMGRKLCDHNNSTGISSECTSEFVNCEDYALDTKSEHVNSENCV